MIPVEQAVPSNPADSDEALMLAYAQEASNVAFESLYQRYRSALYGYCRKQLPPNQADEVFQETWASVIAHRHRYRADRPFRFWLFHIAHNKLVDVLRQKPQSLFSELGESVHDQLAHADETSASDPQQALDADQTRQRMQRALAALPFYQREALLLQQQGFRLEEIADITQTAYESVKSRLRYAFNKLREEWEVCHDR